MKIKRTQDKSFDYVAEFWTWKFIITELVGGDTDYVYRIYVENKNLFVYWWWCVELPYDYKTLKWAKTAVAKFVLKNCCFRL